MKLNRGTLDTRKVGIMKGNSYAVIMVALIISMAVTNITLSLIRLNSKGEVQYVELYRTRTIHTDSTVIQYKMTKEDTTVNWEIPIDSCTCKYCCIKRVNNNNVKEQEKLLRPLHSDRRDSVISDVNDTCGVSVE